MNATRPLLCVADRKSAGHARRALMPRGAHGEWVRPPHRADPVAVIRAAEAGRIEALLPLRHARMATDAFAFLRGAAAIMAADLGATCNADLGTASNSGLHTQLSGDAHLANFGARAGQLGDALFDIVDFDETLPGPFEWDVKRLAASLVVAGQVQGLPDKACRAVARRMVHAYRREMMERAMVPPLEAWQSRIMLESAIAEIGDRDVRKLERQRLANIVEDGRAGFRRLIAGPGTLRLRERPPSLFRLGPQEQTAHRAFEAYEQGLAEERRILMQRYRLVDVAFKAVGVGSVGLFCAIGLYGSADGDSLLLQLKAVSKSVLAEFAGRSAYAHDGQRVVTGQRLLQAEPDQFLGWTQSGGQDFYVRQLKDPRLAAVASKFEAKSLPFYADLCGRTLGRAHARAGDAAMISGYLGEGSRFDDAVSAWALAYAGQNACDFRRFSQAIADGEIAAEMETSA
jgi:uncharacterized protein (DUF2252 family)